jgi:lipopolysaccharide/colanic/teichoic acid biosynthesis glycosyltransferase
MERKIYVQDRLAVKVKEFELLKAKKTMNAQQRVVKRLKTELMSVKSKISRHGSEVRKWNMNHPLEMLDRGV